MNERTTTHNDGELPTVGESALQGRLGENLVEGAVLRLEHLYTRHTGLDFGVDGVIELTTAAPEKRASGRQIGVQVKRGLSVAKRTSFGLTLYCSAAHANYWLEHSLPIIIVHSDPQTEQLRWQNVTGSNLRETKTGYAIDLPEDSDLSNSVDQITALAAGRLPTVPLTGRTLNILYSPQHGVRGDSSEIGIAAVELSRAALRGERYRVLVELEEEADLIAGIDFIGDITSPTNDQRRAAAAREDILHRYRKHIAKMQRAILLLLTEREIAETFGYDDRLLALAILRIARPFSLLGSLKGNVSLQAWPTYNQERPVVTFYVPKHFIEAFYAESSLNRVALRSGSFGGMSVGDLHHEVVAAYFLPELVQTLIDLAEEKGVAEKLAFSEIGVSPNSWLTGLS